MDSAHFLARGEVKQADGFIRGVCHQSKVPVFTKGHIAFKEAGFGRAGLDRAFKAIICDIKNPDIIAAAQAGQAPFSVGRDLQEAGLNVFIPCRNALQARVFHINGNQIGIINIPQFLIPIPRHIMGELRALRRPAEPASLAIFQRRNDAQMFAHRFLARG